MGFVVVVYLYCDGDSIDCECMDRNEYGEPTGQMEASAGDSQFTTVKAYKAYRKAYGWHFKGRKAYCPQCWSTR